MTIMSWGSEEGESPQVGKLVLGEGGDIRNGLGRMDGLLSALGGGRFFQPGKGKSL